MEQHAHLPVLQEAVSGKSLANTISCLLIAVQDVFESLKARKEGRYDHAPKPTRFEKSTPAPAAQKPASSRSRSQTQKLVEKPKKDDNWWEAAAIYEFIRSAVNKRILRPGRDHITLDRVASLMTRRYEIEDVETARNVLLVHAQNLCYKMDHPRSKSASFLSEEPIYRQLEAGHDLPAAEIRRAQGVELRPRRDHTLLEAVESSSSESESPEEVVATPQPRARPDGRKKRGRLSVLRPLSGKFSGKGKSVKSRRSPNLDDHTSEDADSSAEPEQGADLESDSDSVIAIDTPTQVLSPNREKRKFMDMEYDEEEEGSRKRAASSPISPHSPSSSLEEAGDDTEAAEADNEAPLPLRNRASNRITNGKATREETKSDVVVPVISTPLPTYEANGPRDSWHCTFDGCNQMIYGASKIIGRQLITEHLEDHAKGRQQVVGVIWRENQKLALPVKWVHIPTSLRKKLINVQ